MVGIKNCPYFCEGKNVLCTIKICGDEKDMTIQGIPLDYKLPKLDVVDFTLFKKEKEEILKEKKSL